MGILAAALGAAVVVAEGAALLRLNTEGSMVAGDVAVVNVELSALVNVPDVDRVGVGRSVEASLMVRRLLYSHEWRNREQDDVMTYDVLNDVG
jgi:hypothetical protein